MKQPTVPSNRTLSRLALALLSVIALAACGSPASGLQTQIIPQTQIVLVTQIVPVTQIIEITPTLQFTYSPLPTATGPTPLPQSTQVGPLSTIFTAESRLDWQDSGIDLQAGSQISLTYVVGAWNFNFEGGSGYYVGPDGYHETAVIAEEGCNPAPLPDAARGALLARVNNGPIFLAGSRQALWVGETGRLSFRINDDCLDDNDGKITLRVDVQPAGKVGTPIPEPPAAQATYAYTVAAEQPVWQDSGLTLETGQAGTLSYIYGVWSFNMSGGSQYFVGPAGYPYPYSNALDGQCGNLPMPDAPQGALIARIGSGPVFAVGLEHPFKAASRGNLFFRMNDNCMGDDWGTLTIQARLTR